MAIALALVMALIAVAIVLEPLLRAASGRAVLAAEPIFSDSDDEDDPALIRRDRALSALKEIEFDHATGKLSDDDYGRMKTQFTAEALDALRAADAAAEASAVALPPTHPPTDAAIEQLIIDARTRPLTPRRFCLECGAQAEGAGKFCLECGTPVAV